MSLRTLLASTLLVFFAASVFGQISPSGQYFGRVGTSDIMVAIGRQDVSAVYFFNRTLGVVEVASGALRSDGSATWAFNTGRVVSFTLGSGIVTGNVAGSAFTATLEKSVGPFGSRAFGYFGTGNVPATGSYASMLVSITATGRAVYVFFNSTGIQGGVGTITDGGVVTIPQANGVTATFLFQPVDGVATGQVTSPNFFNIQYVLVQGQRPALVNVATRGTVGGGNLLTAGFISTTAAKLFLIRAVGPTLGGFGVPNAQSDPALRIYKGSDQITSNDDWGTAPNQSDIAAATGQVGAFGLTAGSKDSVILVALEPGAYTAQVTGNGPAGDALVEVYEVR